MAREAVIVSYARTGLAKSHRGGFNITPAMSMAAHAIKHAVEKSGVDPAEVEDVTLGNGAHVEAISQPGGGIGGVDPKLIEESPAIFMAMIDTADIVAERYGVTREAQ